MPYFHAPVMGSSNETSMLSRYKKANNRARPTSPTSVKRRRKGQNEPLMDGLQWVSSTDVYIPLVPCQKPEASTGLDRKYINHLVATTAVSTKPSRAIDIDTILSSTHNVVTSPKPPRIDITESSEDNINYTTAQSNPVFSPSIIWFAIRNIVTTLQQSPSVLPSVMKKVCLNSLSGTLVSSTLCNTIALKQKLLTSSTIISSTSMRNDIIDVVFTSLYTAKRQILGVESNGQETSLASTLLNAMYLIKLLFVPQSSQTTKELFCESHVSRARLRSILIAWLREMFRARTNASIDSILQNQKSTNTLNEPKSGTEEVEDSSNTHWQLLAIYLRGFDFSSAQDMAMKEPIAQMDPSLSPMLAQLGENPSRVSLLISSQVAAWKLSGEWEEMNTERKVVYAILSGDFRQELRRMRKSTSSFCTPSPFLYAFGLCLSYSAFTLVKVPYTDADSAFMADIDSDAEVKDNINVELVDTLGLDQILLRTVQALYIAGGVEASKRAGVTDDVFYRIFHSFANTHSSGLSHERTMSELMATNLKLHQTMQAKDESYLISSCGDDDDGNDDDNVEERQSTIALTSMSTHPIVTWFVSYLMSQHITPSTSTSYPYSALTLLRDKADCVRSLLNKGLWADAIWVLSLDNTTLKSTESAKSVESVESVDSMKSSLVLTLYRKIILKYAVLGSVLPDSLLSSLDSVSIVETPFAWEVTCNEGLQNNKNDLRKSFDTYAREAAEFCITFCSVPKTIYRECMASIAQAYFQKGKQMGNQTILPSQYFAALVKGGYRAKALVFLFSMVAPPLLLTGQAAELSEIVEGVSRDSTGCTSSLVEILPSLLEPTFQGIVYHFCRLVSALNSLTVSTNATMDSFEALKRVTMVETMAEIVNEFIIEFDRLAGITESKKAEAEAEAEAAETKNLVSLSRIDPTVEAAALETVREFTRNATSSLDKLRKDLKLTVLEDEDDMQGRESDHRDSFMAEPTCSTQDSNENDSILNNTSQPVVDKDFLQKFLDSSSF